MPASEVRIFDKFFTEEEERKLFKTVHERRADIYALRDYHWMKVLRGTGIRIGVLRQLTLGDAQKAMDTQYLHVRPEINKRRKELDIYVVKSVHDSLNELLKIHKKLSAGFDWEIPALERPLILSRERKAISERSLEHRMKMWITHAGLPAGTPHWWRHTWSKRALANGQGDTLDKLRRIQRNLGHSNLKTTMIYTQPDKAEMQRMMIDAS